MIDLTAIGLIAVIAFMGLFIIALNLSVITDHDKSGSQKITAAFILITTCLILLLAGQIGIYEFNGQHEKTIQLSAKVLMMKGR